MILGIGLQKKIILSVKSLEFDVCGLSFSGSSIAVDNVECDLNGSILDLISWYLEIGIELEIDAKWVDMWYRQC